MHNFISICSLLLEFFISLCIFNTMFTMKIKPKYGIFIGAGIFAIYTVIFLRINIATTNTLAYFIANLTFTLICYYCTTKSAVLISFFLTAVSMGTEFLIIQIFSATTNGDINAFIQNSTIHAILAFSSKFLLFIVSAGAITLGLHFSNRKQKNSPLFLFLFPVVSMVIFYVFWIILSEYELSKNVQLVILVSSIVMVASIILTYIFYGKSSKELDELYKSSAEAERISTDTAYYAVLDRQNEQLKTLIHDEKNHYAAIRALTDSKEIIEYIDTLSNQMKAYSLFGNTKNKMLDLTINKYQYICDAENIDFYVSIKTANLTYISKPDLITLLGNILDNAVEASKKSNKKNIDLSLNRANGFDILTCTNSCDVKPVSENRSLKSTKTDKGFHGLGIKSIKQIVNKYNGSFEWSYDKNEKQFSIYIAFKENT